MPRAIDHLVIAAHDLDQQAALYRQLGFQVGARNRHPWGTQNHIVQFDGAFLELIGLGPGFVAPPARAPVHPFAGYLADYLARREGVAMIVLRSGDAEADRMRFAAAGIGDFARFDFARKGRRPDGSEVEVAFSLAFAAGPALPEAGFFVCQQHFPENFWSRATQVHPNGALGVVGLTIVCHRPADATPFLAAFLEAPARPIEGGAAFALDGGAIECVTPAAFAARHNAPPVGPGVAAARFAVAGLEASEQLLATNGVRFRRQQETLIVEGDDAKGVRLVFEPVA